MECWSLSDTRCEGEECGWLCLRGVPCEEPPVFTVVRVSSDKNELSASVPVDTEPVLLLEFFFWYILSFRAARLSELLVLQMLRRLDLSTFVFEGVLSTSHISPLRLFLCFWKGYQQAFGSLASPENCARVTSTLVVSIFEVMKLILSKIEPYDVSAILLSLVVPWTRSKGLILLYF